MNNKKLCKEMWSIMAETGCGKDKAFEVLKNRHGHLSRPISVCFACEEAVERACADLGPNSDFLAKLCFYCPIDWGYEHYILAPKRPCEQGAYGAWTRVLDEKNRKNRAKQIVRLIVST